MITLTDTRERFLLAIAKEIPSAGIEEIHFFAPLRQSGIESGVAVVAATPDTPLQAPATDEMSRAESGTPPRFVVYTARYRLVLKGPDRGKWEIHVVVEADAPLVTVDAVVRGVQRRAGDLEEPERYSGDDIRELLAVKAA